MLLSGAFSGVVAHTARVDDGTYIILPAPQRVEGESLPPSLFMEQPMNDAATAMLFLIVGLPVACGLLMLALIWFIDRSDKD